MNNLLFKPYPFLFSFWKNLLMAIGFGICAGFINYYRLDNAFVGEYLKTSKEITALFFSLIPFFCILLIFEVLPKLFSEKFKENWNILKEVLLVLGLIFSIVISVYLFFFLISKEEPSFLQSSFIIKIAIYAFSTGSFFSLVVVWINYTVILRNNLKKIKEQNQQLKQIADKNEKIKNAGTATIPTQIKNELIKFNTADLLFIKSEGNYLEVFTQKISGTETKLYRAALQEVEKALAPYTDIMRTHRSYIVNLKKIKRTSGNARNYQLYFEGFQDAVPVSRNRFQDFNERLKSLTD